MLNVFVRSLYSLLVIELDLRGLDIYVWFDLSYATGSLCIKEPVNLAEVVTEIMQYRTCKRLFRGKSLKMNVIACRSGARLCYAIIDILKELVECCDRRHLNSPTIIFTILRINSEQIITFLI